MSTKERSPLEAQSLGRQCIVNITTRVYKRKRHAGGRRCTRGPPPRFIQDGPRACMHRLAGLWTPDQRPHAPCVHPRIHYLHCSNPSGEAHTEACLQRMHACIHARALPRRLSVPGQLAQLAAEHSQSRTSVVAVRQRPRDSLRSRPLPGCIAYEPERCGASLESKKPASLSLSMTA